MKPLSIVYFSLVVLACLAIGDNTLAHAARSFPALAGIVVALLIAGTGKKLEDFGLIG